MKMEKNAKNENLKYIQYAWTLVRSQIRSQLWICIV